MVDCGGSLSEPLFDGVPFIGGDDSGDEIEGEHSFFAFIGAVNVEGDALVSCGDFLEAASVLDFVVGEDAEGVDYGLVVLSRGAIGLKSFIIGVKACRPSHCSNLMRGRYL